MRVGRAAGMLLMLMLAAAVLAGCAGRRSTDVPYATESFDSRPDQIFTDIPDHRLGPTDLISVTVFRAPELTGDYRVDAGGNIQMPLIGTTSVQGMTTVEVADRLKQTLGGRYYVDPDVTVALKESGVQRITIDGSVNAPGLYPIAGETTLMQAVAMARGASEDANLRKVVVFRQIDGRRNAAAFDLKAIRSAEMEDPTIYASDIIIVDGNSTRRAFRDVLQAIPLLAIFSPL